MQNPPFVSIIVPTFNNPQLLTRSVGALASSTYQPSEIIVVDDGSTDNSTCLSLPAGVRVVRLSRRSGPAVARNHGSRHARGDVLLFIDSDVLVRPDTVSQVAAKFEHDCALAAVFGSYDAAPAEETFVSQYKNLHHHFIHQQASPDATTFWAGCGAVRREAFVAVGGFDEQRYGEPSIEDIELGYRLKEAGYKIALDKRIQVKHLKRWEFRTLLYTDIFRRAIPWTRLLLERRYATNSLNLQMRERLSAGLVGLFVALALCGLFAPPFFFGAAILMSVFFGINSRWYLFLLKRRGLGFTLKAVPMHLLYYFYSGVVFVVYWGWHQLARRGLILSRGEVKTCK